MVTSCLVTVPAFVPVTKTETNLPTSPATGVYVLVVALGIAVHVDGTEDVAVVMLAVQEYQAYLNLVKLAKTASIAPHV